MDSQTLLNLGLVLLFVVVGGVFAATEIALVSLRESQLVQLKQRSARGARVASVARDPNRFLAAVQIGVTVAGFFSAAYGGSTLAPDVAPVLERLGLSEGAADATALVLMTLLIAYLSLVLGELVPKRLALQRSAALAVVVAPPLDRFATAMRPVIALLSLSTNAVVRLLGGYRRRRVRSCPRKSCATSSRPMRVSTRRSVGSSVTSSRRGRSSLREVMQPRGDVEFLPGSLSLAQASEQVASRSHSRFPVMDDDFDDVSGFLHVRDLLGVDADDPRHVRDVQREILTLPSTNKVLPTVSLMRKRGVHLALVVDEYGGTDGIAVTLEDLVEEIVGEIRDEYDEPDAGRAEPGRVDGAMSLEDFNDHTGLELPDGDYDTVAGYLVARVGRIPDVGDSVAVGDTLLEVVAMIGMRVTAIRVGNGPGGGHERRRGPREGRTVGRRSPSGSLSERSP